MNGWEKVRLGDCFKLSSGKSLIQNKRSGDKFPVYGGNGFSGKHDDFFVYEPTIVIGRVGAYCGCVHITNPNSWITDNALYIKEFLKEIELRYLFYALSAANLHQYANTSGQPSISQTSILKTEIPLPPLEEQRRIAEILDLASSLIEKRKKQIELLDTLAKSLFIEMFGDPVENPRGWEVDKIKNRAPAVLYKEKIKGNKLWLLNLDAVESNTGKILFKNYVEKDEIGNSTCCFNSDNILYSKLRPYLNKVVIPDDVGYATSELIPLKPIFQSLNRLFLAYLLRSDNFVNYISDKVAGAKMPRVSMNDFWDFPVILPPISLQNEFAERIELIEARKSDLQNSLEKLEMNYKALMQMYFEDA